MENWKKILGTIGIGIAALTPGKSESTEVAKDMGSKAGDKKELAIDVNIGSDLSNEEVFNLDGPPIDLDTIPGLSDLRAKGTLSVEIIEDYFKQYPECFEFLPEQVHDWTGELKNFRGFYDQGHDYATNPNFNPENIVIPVKKEVGPPPKYELLKVEFSDTELLAWLLGVRIGKDKAKRESDVRSGNSGGSTKGQLLKQLNKDIKNSNCGVSESNRRNVKESLKNRN